MTPKNRTARLRTSRTSPTTPRDAAHALVRSGEVTARELVEASLARIDEVDERVNAFTLVDREGALATADGISDGDKRPFAGVPVAIKDLATPVAGMVMSQGMELFGDYTPDYDAYVVRRLREAGFVIMGKTSSPELGIVPVTEPRRYGPTRNPWNLDRTPGGSSGGSGAAVAGGMVPIAHGSDGGGSIRIPAACCGLVGLKPSRGRISRGPDLGDAILSTDGMLTRTVEDCARTLDVLAGYEPGDATWAPPPDEPFANAVGRDPGKLRLGLITQPPIKATLIQTNHIEPVKAAIASATRSPGVALACSASSSPAMRFTLACISSLESAPDVRPGRPDVVDSRDSVMLSPLGTRSAASAVPYVPRERLSTHAPFIGRSRRAQAGHPGRLG